MNLATTEQQRKSDEGGLIVLGGEITTTDNEPITKKSVGRTGSAETATGDTIGGAST